jgi:hypothetical protein
MGSLRWMSCTLVGRRRGHVVSGVDAWRSGESRTRVESATATAQLLSVLVAVADKGM